MVLGKSYKLHQPNTLEYSSTLIGGGGAARQKRGDAVRVKVVRKKWSSFLARAPVADHGVHEALQEYFCIFGRWVRGPEYFCICSRAGILLYLFPCRNQDAHRAGALDCTSMMSFGWGGVCRTCAMLPLHQSFRISRRSAAEHRSSGSASSYNPTLTL